MFATTLYGMPMASIIPRRTIVQLRFKPQFDFPDKIGTIGKTAQEITGFEEWLRDPQQAVIFERSLLKVVSIRNGEVATTIDSFAPEEKDRLKWGCDIVLKIAAEYGQNEYFRAGVRQWYAISVGARDEAAIMRKVKEKYFSVSNFESALGLEVEDHAQVLEFQNKSDSRKTARLEFGPMSRTSNEWQARLSYDPNKEVHLTSAAVEAIAANLPTDFIYLDLDRGFKAKSQDEPLTSEAVKGFLDDMLKSETAIAKQFIKDLG